MRGYGATGRGSLRGKSSRGDSTNGFGRGKSNTGVGRGACVHFKRGTCRFGSSCKYSHDLVSSRHDDRLSRHHNREKGEETTEQLVQRVRYQTWRSLIRKLPLPNDYVTMAEVWNGALEILNADDRDRKQAFPKDLDSDDLYGHQHIQSLLGTRSRQQQYVSFIEASNAYLMVMTHPAMVDCLSVDTYVGGLYTFMSGTNGSRAIPFFQHLCEVVALTYDESPRRVSSNALESTLISLSASLLELVRREHRARFSEDLPDLISSLETTTQLIVNNESTVTASVVNSRASDLRAIVSRAQGLLTDEEDNMESRYSQFAKSQSTYPRDIVMPRGRHDNDSLDITAITIFPTRGELVSEAKEFLPSIDRDQPHFITNKGERHIDTLFRLFRHDTFGALKDTLVGLIKAITHDRGQLAHPKFDYKDTHTYQYPAAYVSYLMLHSRGGLQAQVSFPQPKTIRKASTDKRKWWEESRRLQEGVLLSFIWLKNSEVQHLFFTVAERSTDPKKSASLISDSHIATITLKLSTQNQSAVEALLELSQHKTKVLLLEFPHVLPATFAPVLENLQNMQRVSQLPFREWILPDLVDDGSTAQLKVPPPSYARQANFAFPLTSITKLGANPRSVPASSSVDDADLISDLEATTDLDRGQCVALVAALTREFAFIQGPPGTGKSYLGVKLMKALLEVRRLSNLGPVVVVTYTNHALDQFLEHLLATGISKIIRVGGSSRSDLLEGHNLRKIAQTEGKTKYESWQAATAYKNLSEYKNKSQRILGRLHITHKRREWRYYSYHLSRKYQSIHRQFNDCDSEGYKTVGHPFDQWAKMAQPSKAESSTPDTKLVVVKARQDVNMLSSIERGSLIEMWNEEIDQAAREDFYELVKDADAAGRDLSNVHEETHRRVLQGADVIGLTTSGLAKNISTMRHVRAKVIICEEAGEVMEPHMISALLPSVEHFIQIGDHQQLRPTINNFRDLSLESDKGILYQLDRSQFERLSIGERGRPRMPLAQLNVQRRMRPEISSLIQATLYEKLQDHPSTALLPDVVGMRKNLFWLDHTNHENGSDDEISHNKSKSNDWEVDMVHALVRHVVRQGIYSSSDIAVLTPYTGQLQKLRLRMLNDFEIVLSERDEKALAKDGFTAEELSQSQTVVDNDNQKKPLEKKKLSELLRVATVDNFQGEEAKVVIVSLVRSNANRKVGFLKTTNRINVLLSRAQHGMYLVGNAGTYSHVPMWEKVIGMMRATESLGNSLALCCPRHKDKVMEVQHPDDFPKFSPEGGCREACMDRLPDCGHRCQARCHSETMHRVFRCEQPCQRRHQSCNHLCQQSTCGEDCGHCMIVIRDIQLPCGHVKNRLSCHLTQDLTSVTCEARVDKRVASCGHVVNVPCPQDVDAPSFRCANRCGMPLSCGHPCPGSCAQCNTKDSEDQPVLKHMKCRKLCSRPFGTCNHLCPKPCHDGSGCGLCTSQCEVACRHSRCTLKCHEACAPCIERCTWSCPHQGDCTMPCSAPCNRLPCDERCTKVLPCGHQCPGLCGEDCLVDCCQQCQVKLDAQVDMIELKDYGEIDLNETPVVALACGHFFTAQTLDGMVGISEVYDIDARTGAMKLKNVSGGMATTIPKCPHCKRPVRQFVTQRYNRLINRAVIDEMSRRFIVTGQKELQDLENRLLKVEAKLEAAPPGDFLASAAQELLRRKSSAENDLNEKLAARYGAVAKLEHDVEKFQRQAATRHQPAHKLHDAIVHRVQQNIPLEQVLENLSLEGPETLLTSTRDERITSGAIMLKIKIKSTTLEDVFRILSNAKTQDGIAANLLKFPAGPPLDLVKSFLQFCTDFIAECRLKALPKLAVEASLHYAQTARLYETSGLASLGNQEMTAEYREHAKLLLNEAATLCAGGFRDAATLLQAVIKSLGLMRTKLYEQVTPEELQAIKAAMVSGPRGIATHSGHWYNCVNGHPFAIGECGMPMELARCPECGAVIGGQNHVASQGVTRAEGMER